MVTLRLPALRERPEDILILAEAFLAEFAREPDAFLGVLWFGLSMGQLLCLPMFAAGLFLMLRRQEG